MSFAFRFLSVALVLFSNLPLFADERPNILLIMSDDMGFSDLGCYGGEIATPNLDALAADGLRFTQFYNTGRCCPTRASLLTGLYPHQAGIGHMTANYGLPQYQGQLNDQCVTIAEALAPAGYATFMCGKWHVCRNIYQNGDQSQWPLQRGFQKFYGTLHGAGSFFDPNSLTRGNTHVSPEADPAYQPEGPYYYTDAITDNTIAHLRGHIGEHPDQPFFHYVAYTAAHWPLHALPEDIAKYDGKYDGGYQPVYEARVKKMKELGLIDGNWEIPGPARDWSKVELKEWESACMEVYAAMVDRMDQGIGKIVSYLRESGQLDNTLILFLQDNGGCAEEFGRGKLEGPLARPDAPTLPPLAKEILQTEMVPAQSRDGYPLRRGDGVIPGFPETQIGYGLGWANVSNTPFREYKHWVHEGGISTPLVAHWPDGFSAKNEFRKEPAHLIDIMATCLDLAGAEYPATKIPVEGVSLKPAFDGKPLERGKPIFWEHEGNRAVREGDWKLVAKGVNSPWELYNIPDDRTEQKNLIDQETERAMRMAGQYEAWAKERGVVPFGSWEKKEGSSQKKFIVKPGDTFETKTSPAVANRPFVVRATLAAGSGPGVIVAQGGTSKGWSLYLRGKELCFAIRSDGELFLVTGMMPEAGAEKVAARVLRNGIELLADGKRVAFREGRQLVPGHPVDPLEIGKDSAGLVGDYGRDNALTPPPSQVIVELK